MIFTTNGPTLGRVESLITTSGPDPSSRYAGFRTGQATGSVFSLGLVQKQSTPLEVDNFMDLGFRTTERELARHS